MTECQIDFLGFTLWQWDKSAEMRTRDTTKERMHGRQLDEGRDNWKRIQDRGSKLLRMLGRKGHGKHMLSTWNRYKNLWQVCKLTQTVTCIPQFITSKIPQTPESAQLISSKFVSQILETSFPYMSFHLSMLPIILLAQIQKQH